jgi:SRSO17 transposase
MDAVAGGPGTGVVEGWAADFDLLMGRVGPCFSRHDLRGRAGGYVRGLLGRVERKNGWQVAEHLGDDNPYGVQRLLGRARWDAGEVRDEVVRYAREHLLAPGEGGLLVVDETGLLKKGDKSAGVQRQYSGTAGRVENCQIGVFLALAGSRGRALVDRALYLPEGWCDDRARRKAAGVPQGVTFATKPALALRMLDRAFAAGLKPAWVLADEVYGNDGKFRRHLEGLGQPFVVAVGAHQRLWVDLRQRRVDRIADELPADAWRRLSVGDGSKGPRAYDWAAGRLGGERPRGLVRWVLVRRSVPDPADRAYYLCLAPPEATGADLAVAAGGRWSIETCFEAAKREAGLDEYEVRTWDGWHRHVTLSMLALAFLAAVRARAAAAAATRPPEPAHRAAGEGGGKRNRAAAGRGKKAAGARAGRVGGPGPAHRAGGPPADAGHRVAGPQRGRAGAGVVGVAPPAPGRRPAVPLPGTRADEAQNAKDAEVTGGPKRNCSTRAYALGYG